MASSTDLGKLAALLEAKPRITVLTGAGVSVASGIPTFRGPEGIWKDFKPEEVATPQAFERDPKFVWEWYQYRRDKLRECKPNRGHEVLAAWSKRYPGFKLFTQNVDGLHELAGTENVIRYHGSLWDVGCWEQCPEAPYRWRDETETFPALPPPCPYCGGILRPGVVWFGEMIDPEVLSASMAATQCELFLAIGTSSVVYPAASMVESAKEQGAFTVEINPEATDAAPYLDLALAGKSEEVLDAVEALLT
jgi:NAD-dependent deacetylase